MSPLNVAICTTTYLERQKCYGPDKKILFKKRGDISFRYLKQIFLVYFKFNNLHDTNLPWHLHSSTPTYPYEHILLHNKHRSRKVITVCDTPPCGHAPTYQISLTYLERHNYLTLRSKVKVQLRSLWYATHRLVVMHPHTVK
jgi:hypothetical protein